MCKIAHNEDKAYFFNTQCARLHEEGADAVENKPDGAKLLKTLINLLADQEGVKIEYEIEKGGKDETHTG